MAHWETNGADLSPDSRPVATQMMPNPLKRTTIPMPAQDEAALAMRPIPKPRTSFLLSTTRIASLQTDSSFQSEPTVSDQWQIASKVQPIVINSLDDPETDDFPPVPSAIHRDNRSYLPLPLPFRFFL